MFVGEDLSTSTQVTRQYLNTDTGFSGTSSGTSKTTSQQKQACVLDFLADRRTVVYPHYAHTLYGQTSIQVVLFSVTSKISLRKISNVSTLFIGSGIFWNVPQLELSNYKRLAGLIK
jgi:hypothetical protein